MGFISPRVLPATSPIAGSLAVQLSCYLAISQREDDVGVE